MLAVLSISKSRLLVSTSSALTRPVACGSTQLLVRHYSPVRSRVHMPPPPRRILRRRAAGTQQQQQQYDNTVYEPPQVEYSYPFLDNARTPPPGGIIRNDDAVASILSHPVLVVERQIEFMNVFLGFEQANRYAILDPQGNHLGYMEEEDFGIVKAVMRQVYRLHRPFSVRVLDRYGQHVLTIKRPFSFINSRIKLLLPSEREENSIIVGESKQQWHLWRRRYNLFLYSGDDTYEQFGRVDAPFLSFNFGINNAANQVIGAVDRNWVGLGRELFTDTGVYMLRLDRTAFISPEQDPTGGIYPNEVVSPHPLTLDQRAVVLGTAVSIDFDYFSRHSGNGGMVSFSSYE